MLVGFERLGYGFPNPYPDAMYETGFKPLPLILEVWCRLPTAARIRSGKFRYYKVPDLLNHCAEMPGIGRGPDAVAWREWRRLPLNAFRERVAKREAELQREEDADTDG
jgi:hypothetical protein